MLQAELVTPVRVFYRRALRQARLFAYIWQDPVLFASHRALARRQAEASARALHVFTNIKRTASDKKIPEVNTKEWWIYFHKKRLTGPGRGWNAAREKLARQKKQETIHVKQIAAANVGWPHAVTRALNEGYGRSGPLRWELLKPFLPKHDPNTDRRKASPRSQKSPKDPKPELPRRLQSPSVSRSLRSLVLSAAAHSASIPAASQFDLPPKLVIAMQKKAGLFPSENEAVAALDGIERNLQAIGITRNREANARWRWLTSHIHKLHPPIEGEEGEGEDGMEAGPSDPARHVSAIEARVRDRQPTIPKRVRAAMLAEGVQGEHASLLPSQDSTTPQRRAPSPRYLQSARKLANEIGNGGRDFTQTADEPKYAYKRVKPKSTEASMSYNLVKSGGWARSGPVDYEREHRARRRMWADLLSRIPKPVYYQPKEAELEEQGSLPFGVLATEADVAVPDLGQEEEEGGVESGAVHQGQSGSRRLPTLQARSSTYRLAAAREWKFWADYDLEGTSSEPRASTTALQAEPTPAPASASSKDVPSPKTAKTSSTSKKPQRKSSIAPLKQSEYAHGPSSGPRAAQKDSGKWVADDELRWIWETRAPVPSEKERG
ncbi:hypothetical protein CF327_g5369 [Tilletia walkeri]|uniref:Uncharacterized protein n=1 Tax=Tilletia walkeri TaxID=117179 RepID=A0A8X7T3X1_9BASI|nr:hypothetical protein CF327_g5369 [Tilletia walkeri]KAE8267957.1 hypothetical protein A4X09_0g4395 [Tilletia walkeri]